MSSILKALRKLEEEKAAMGTGGVEIARDILKRSSTGRGKNYGFSLIAALFLGAIVATGIGFLILARPPKSDLAEITPTPVLPGLSQHDAANSHSSEAETPVPAPSSLPPVLSISPASAPETPPSVVDIPPRQSLPLEPAAKTAGGLPYLRLSGIAFRQNPAERIAILNDLPVMQGTSIEGAQVIDILPDRVVMQWQGQEFQLRIESE